MRLGGVPRPSNDPLMLDGKSEHPSPPPTRRWVPAAANADEAQRASVSRHPPEAIA
jgi:hypothetical protein